MSVEMKTLTINNVTYEVIDETARNSIPGMATTSTLGTVMVDGTAGIGVNSENGNLYIAGAETTDIDGKAHSYKPITPKNLDYAVKAGLVDNASMLSDTERGAALSWLGAATINHTHNFGDNITGGVVNDTVSFWVEKESGYCWISELEQITDQPSQYGFLINYTGGTDAFQIFRDQSDGTTYFRSGDSTNGWFQSWTKVVTVDSEDYINNAGIKAYGQVFVAENDTSMAIYANGIGSGSGNVWIDQAGDAYFISVSVGTKDNYKLLATQEYVDAAIEAAIGDMVGGSY